MTVIRDEGFRWCGVPVKTYKDPSDAHRGVTRMELLGDGPGQEALAFVTRYFEVAPGGWTSLEHHRHPHAVVVLRGEGTALLGNDRHRIRAHDAVYVAPGSPHQFRADRDSVLGFLCIVDRERDRPTPLQNAGD